MFAFEIVVSVLCLSGFAFLFYDALRMPFPQQFWDGPGAFPAILASLLFVLSLYWLITTIVGQMRKPQIPEAEKSASVDSSTKALKREEIKRLAMIISTMITFPIATFVYLFITIMLFTRKGWVIPLVVSVSATLFVYLVFNYVLYLPMPR